MELVRIAVLSFVGCGLAAGADFGIDIGSPVAAAPAGNAGSAAVTKLKGAIFSVRTHGCSGEATLTALAKYVGGAEYPLALTPGNLPGTFTVFRHRPEVWVAAITADCNGTKAGAIVPVDAQGLYQREAIKFYSHAPTAAEVNDAWMKVKGGSR